MTRVGSQRHNEKKGVSLEFVLNGIIHYFPANNSCQMKHKIMTERCDISDADMHILVPRCFNVSPFAFSVS